MTNMTELVEWVLSTTEQWNPALKVLATIAAAVGAIGTIFGTLYRIGKWLRGKRSPTTAEEVIGALRNAGFIQPPQRRPRTGASPLFGCDSLSATPDLDSLLETALAIVTQVTSTDYAQLFLIATGSHSKQLVAVADSIPPRKQRYRFATFQGLLGAALETGQIVNVPDTRQHRSYFPAVAETRSELVVPVRGAGRVIGLINVESELPSHFGEDMVRKLDEMSDCLAENLARVGWTEQTPSQRLPWIQKG
jgi:putative methionine-R-sulfoxide reductase with GAF domain